MVNCTLSVLPHDTLHLHRDLHEIYGTSSTTCQVVHYKNRRERRGLFRTYSLRDESTGETYRSREILRSYRFCCMVRVLLLLWSTKNGSELRHRQGGEGGGGLHLRVIRYVLETPATMIEARTTNTHFWRNILSEFRNYLTQYLSDFVFFPWMVLREPSLPPQKKTAILFNERFMAAQHEEGCYEK